jgi:sugar-specific transcriptional regulator TrmB
MKEEVQKIIKTLDSTKEKLKETNENYEIEKRELENKLKDLKRKHEKEVGACENVIQRYSAVMETINEIVQNSQRETTILQLFKGMKDLNEMDFEYYDIMLLIDSLKPFQKFTYENDKKIEKIVSYKQASALIKKRMDWIHGLSDKKLKELLYRCIILPLIHLKLPLLNCILDWV